MKARLLAILLLCLPVLAQAATGAAQAGPTDAAASSTSTSTTSTSTTSTSTSTIVRLAAGVWRIAGDNAAINAGNQGAIVNTGVIATGEGVIVIDPGPSQRRAAAIGALIGSVTAEPVRWIIDTHPHPENVLGNSGFPEAEVIASAATAEQMQGRCSLCLQRLVDQLGAPAMRETVIRLPTRIVTDGQTLLLGQRRLRFLVFAQAHSRGDLAVILPDAGVLFAGGLVNDRRVPDLREAALTGWIEALNTLEQLAMPSVVPGHGSATDGAAIGRFGRYLTDLKAACDRDIAQHGDAASSGARLTLPAYRGWAEYDAQHRFNVARAYREREDAQLMEN